MSIDDKGGAEEALTVIVKRLDSWGKNGVVDTVA